MKFPNHKVEPPKKQNLVVRHPQCSVGKTDLSRSETLALKLKVSMSSNYPLRRATWRILGQPWLTNRYPLTPFLPLLFPTDVSGDLELASSANTAMSPAIMLKAVELLRYSTDT